MGRRAAPETVVGTEMSSDEPNGEASADPNVPLTSAQRLAASSVSSVEVAPDPFGREAKHFTEIRVLNREVSAYCHSLFGHWRDLSIILSDGLPCRSALYWRVLTNSAT